MSANKLCFPLRCCEYSVEFYLRKIRTMWQELCLCIGFVVGLKFDLCIHPTDDVLSIHPKQKDNGGIFSFRESIQMHTNWAINSRRLFVWML